MSRFDLDDFLIWGNGEVYEQAEPITEELRETALVLGKKYSEDDDESYHGISYKRWSQFILCSDKKHRYYFNKRIKMWMCVRCGSFGRYDDPFPAEGKTGWRTNY
jgi:hypothetical protein